MKKFNLKVLASLVFISSSWSAAQAFPQFPRRGEVLLNAATRAPIAFDFIAEVTEAKCVKDFDVMTLKGNDRLSIGSESYDVIEWLCLPASSETGKFTSYMLNAVHSQFKNRISVDVTESSIWLIDGGQSRPVTEISRY